MPNSDPDFQGLSLKDKAAYLQDTDADFRALTPQQKTAYLTEVHYGAPPQPKQPTGFISAFTGEVPPEQQRGAMAGVGRVLRMPYDIGRTLGAPPEGTLEKGLSFFPGAVQMKRLIQPQIQTGEKALQPGISLSERVGYTAGAALPLVGPWAANLGERAGRGDISGAAAELGSGLVLGKLGEVGAGRLSPEALRIRNLESGTERLTSALKPKVGKAGEAGFAMQRDIQAARPYLSEISREQPLERTILQKFGVKGDPEWFNETAQKIDNRMTDLWDEAHNPGIKKHAGASVEEQIKDISDKLHKSIDPMDDSIQAQRAHEWIDREVGNKIKTIGNLDAKIRRINAETASRKQLAEYGPINLKIETEAARLLRNALDDRLESLGEPGVKDVNRAWGAMRNIRDRLNERYFQESNKAGSSSIIPDWGHAFAYAHPAGGIGIGTAINVSRALRPEAANLLFKGMEKLGRAGLEAPVRVEPIVGNLPNVSGYYRAALPAAGEGTILPSTGRTFDMPTTGFRRPVRGLLPEYKEPIPLGRARALPEAPFESTRPGTYETEKAIRLGGPGSTTERPWETEPIVREPLRRVTRNLKSGKMMRQYLTGSKPIESELPPSPGRFGFRSGIKEQIDYDKWANEVVEAARRMTEKRLRK